jgi:hypothetical protein
LASIKKVRVDADLVDVAMSITDGARLMRTSYGVVRRDRALLSFPAISVACLGLTAGFWIYTASSLYELRGRSLVLVPVVVAGLYSLAFIGTFFSVALAGTAATVIDGGEPSFNDGVNVALARLGSIAGWACYSVFVGVLIGFLKSIKGFRWLGTAAQVAWSFATIFVVPLIAVEGLGAGTARRRSLQIAKENWRAESGGLGALQAALLVPGLVIYFDAKLLFGGHVHSLAAKALLGAVFLCGIGLVMAVSIIRQVFAVSLYRTAAAADPA